MAYIIGLIVLLIVLGAMRVRARKNRKPEAATKAPPQHLEAAPGMLSELLNSPHLTAQQIADRIRSKKDFNALLREIDRLNRKLGSAGISEKNYDKIADLSNKLQEAENIAQAKTIAWQLIVAESLDVPSEILAHAFKIYAADDTTIDRKALERDGVSWWTSLDPYSEPEDAPKSLAALRAFRKIVEGDGSVEDKVHAIDKLYAKMKDLFEGILVPSESLSAGQQWVAQVLTAQGLPNARDLVASGVLTGDNVLKIDSTEFKKRKGVGSARFKQFVEFQNRMRAVAGKHGDGGH